MQQDALWKDTPYWFLPWGKRLGPVETPMLITATYLLRRIMKFRRVLHRTDAWVCPVTRRLLYQPPDANDVTPYLPLAIGDCLQYTQVLRVPFVTHDMIYVGLGCVVGFQRHGDDKTGLHDDAIEGCIQIDSLDVIKVAGKRILRSIDGGRSLLSRYDVACRALCSLGWYEYGGATFNCQHAYELMLGNQHFSLGLVRLSALTIPGTLILYCAVLVMVIVLWITTESKPVPKLAAPTL